MGRCLPCFHHVQMRHSARRRSTANAPTAAYRHLLQQLRVLLRFFFLFLPRSSIPCRQCSGYHSSARYFPPPDQTGPPHGRYHSHRATIPNIPHEHSHSCRPPLPASLSPSGVTIHFGNDARVYWVPFFSSMVLRQLACMPVETPLTR